MAIKGSFGVVKKILAIEKTNRSLYVGFACHNPKNNPAGAFRQVQRGSDVLIAALETSASVLIIGQRAALSTTARHKVKISLENLAKTTLWWGCIQTRGLLHYAIWRSADLLQQSPGPDYSRK